MHSLYFLPFYKFLCHKLTYFMCLPIKKKFFRQQKFMSQKEIAQCIRKIKNEMANLAHLIDALEKFANKVTYLCYVVKNSFSLIV